MSPDKQSSSAKSKKNKKNQANKQNADSSKPAEDEAQNDAVEEELNDGPDGGENQAQDVNGESKSTADPAAEQQNPNEHNDDNNDAPEPGTKITTKPTGSEDSSKFDDLVRDRDSLRAEVTELRKSLEQIQLKHEEEMEALQQKLNESEDKKT